MTWVSNWKCQDLVSLMGISVEQNTYIYDMWAENGGFLNSDYSD